MDDLDLEIMRAHSLHAIACGIARLKWLAAAERFELAMRRHDRALKANFNPAQPRDELGKWTDTGAGSYVRVAGGGRSIGGGRGRFGTGDFPGATYGQLIRLDQAVAREQNLTAQVRQYDPNWKPSEQSLAASGSIEGSIRESEARAADAENRLEQLRSGIGGNFGPPLGPSRPQVDISPLSSRSFDGEAWIGAYRTANNMPDLFGQSTWPSDKGTVAVTEIEGKIYFGTNSTVPSYTDADWNVARNARDSLIEKYPDVMATDKIGEMPNNSPFHAESTVLMRAAIENGGTLAGKEIEMHTDRDMCDSCQTVLPYLARELGNPTVTIIDHRTGTTWIVRDGIIGKRQ